MNIDLDYTGITTVINSKTYNLGMTFTQGVAPPEVNPYSGEIVYVDNRASITRSSNPVSYTHLTLPTICSV